MHGLILAGGEGSRLAADGVVTPKALVSVGGEPQLLTLARRLAALSGAPATCLVRDEALRHLSPALEARLAPVARITPCLTPTSLHTLVAGLDALPPGPVFCAMVDTVMRDDDWRRAYAESARLLAGGADAALVVTPPPDDDAPLWIALGDGDAIVRVGGGPSSGLVTAGVYAFGASARARAAAALAAGRQRMRAFLTELVADGADVRAVHVARAIDVDHARDLAAANAYLAASAAPGSLSFIPPCR